MLPLTLEGDTLGEKRRHFNKLVADAVASNHYELTPISDTDSDIDNLLKIEIACKTRNVDYVIEVMKSKDMLYAATAIKKSTWLITDPQYANIINPEYLHTQLKPYMTTKAFNKLLLHIRLNLKDETRVEAFYEHIKDVDSACKWLQNCSIPFVENVVKSERHVPMWLFKRLCKRSASLLSYCNTLIKPYLRNLQTVLFMLKSQTEYILNIIEDRKSKDFYKIGKHKTEFLMKKCPQRVIDNFQIYCNYVDLSVLAKYIKKKEMQSFLHKHANYIALQLYDCESWGYFINKIPVEERFEFVKNTFIDKTDTGVSFTEEVRRQIDSYIKTYHWYEFAPFDIAFDELKKLIRKESQPADRCAILLVLISCGSKKLQHIKTLLKFLKDKHVNEPFKFKIKFIYKLLFSTAVHEYDVDTWSYLNQLFYSMEVYTQTEKCVDACRDSIILYKVLHDEPVPDIVKKNLSFHSFQTTQRTLNRQQQTKLFTYLLNTLWAQTKSASEITNENDFSETIFQTRRVFMLLKDWKQEITCYKFILERIQELIKLKDKKEWTVNMSCLYNVNKSWRKYMFEESLSLSLCEETCLNALKHKPQLLTRHDKQIHTLRTNDTVSLRRVLAKLRVYWPDSLARHWTEAYMQSLNGPSGHKAIINGIFLLSPIDQVVQLAKKYVPSETKINWSDSNQADINIQKNIAKQLHVARPLVPLGTVLWYAKGDYLQYAVPSLSAILSNISQVESREYLPQLLDAPVSLQKFGLHLTHTKFDASEIKPVFSDIWKSTKNATIRAVIFEHTFNQLSSSKNQNIFNELWKLLSIFMQDLNSQESTSVYKILSNVKSVPINVRGKYYMKSYEILKSLPESHNCVQYLNTVIAYAAPVMELLDEDFVVNKLLSPVESTFCTYNRMYLNAFACFLLCGKSEENQLQRFRRIERGLDEAFQRWHDIHSDVVYMKKHFKQFLMSLVKNFQEYFIHNKTSIPVKLFEEIQSKIQKELQLVENYELFTIWTLVTEYVKCMNVHASNISNILQSSTSDNSWEYIHLEVSPSLGKKIIEYLKEDTEKYSLAIYDLFADALSKMFSMFNYKDVTFILEILAHMLYDREFIPSYLVVCRCIPKYGYGNDRNSIRSEIVDQIKSHPSPLVRMQYHRYF
ncbi:uncharacterized protein LOC111360097 isoform X2 [Spodoptera litura]|uniref:Uncharacterized protein LOC111360097 isoform X2 n=1 Tax=Spodoptera litura TaxID=69820 RepID=A0A9J7EJN3_SPOLT|nr:uncharacterized protein LOC111360097 isoform X2 [Spodoptera litura]